jgi:hypothetical protein
MRGQEAIQEVFASMMMTNFRANPSRVIVMLALTVFVICQPSAAQEVETPPSASGAAVNPQLPTLFVIGDSTANNNANGGLGWADPFVNYFDPMKLNVVNRARGGRSSRTFATEELWDKVRRGVHFRGRAKKHRKLRRPAALKRWSTLTAGTYGNS